MDMLNRLVTSRRFWLTIFAVIQTVVFQLLPDINPAIWQSIDALVLVLIGAFTVDDTVDKLTTPKG